MKMSASTPAWNHSSTKHVQSLAMIKQKRMEMQDMESSVSIPDSTQIVSDEPGIKHGNFQLLDIATFIL